MVIRMGIIAWIVLGLIAGAIAKAIMPGEQGGGWFATLILGVVDRFWSLKTWLLSIVGSLIVLWIYGAITKNKAS